MMTMHTIPYHIRMWIPAYLKSLDINSIKNGNFLTRKLRDALLEKWNKIQPHITSNFANLISKRIADTLGNINCLFTLTFHY